MYCVLDEPVRRSYPKLRLSRFRTDQGFARDPSIRSSRGLLLPSVRRSHDVGAVPGDERFPNRTRTVVATCFYSVRLGRRASLLRPSAPCHYAGGSPSATEFVDAQRDREELTCRCRAMGC